MEQMGRPRWMGVLCLWPGLPYLAGGRVCKGLALGTAATLALNAAVFSGSVWTELLPQPWLTIGWLGVAAFWSAAAILALREFPVEFRAAPQGDADRLYREALAYYLKKRWPDVERCLKGILRSDPQDGDALFHLAAVYRRMNRPSEASACLRRCRRSGFGRKWHWELSRESKLAGQ